MEKILSLRCKNCGYPLEMDDKSGKYVCKACGSEFEIQSDIASDDSFTVVAGVLEKYTGSSPIIKIPEGVSIIGKECFKDMELIESISLPNSIIKIDSSSFQGCSRLKYINFPEFLSSIGDFAFKESGIEDAMLPNSISMIGKDAFMGCINLKKVTLPSKSNIVYDRTFKQCTALSDVTLDFSCFCLSFKSSTEAKKNSDTRSTLFDAFQATPYLAKLNELQKNKQCIVCGSTIGKNGICSNCGAKHVDLSGGCYIATAVYGTYDCPQVWTLRRYRDNTLAETWYGRAFIKMYYSISPTIVKWFGKKVWFNNIWKSRLDKMVNRLNIKGVESTPYND